MPADPLDLDALAKLADAATAGPWTIVRRVDEFDGTEERWVRFGASSEDSTSLKDRDAVFIAAARSAVPALLAELREARRERDEQEASAALHARRNQEVSDALGQKIGESWHDLGAKVAKLKARADADKIRADGHAEALRSIREMLQRDPPDVASAVQWCSDSLSGYVSPADCCDRAAAEIRAIDPAKVGRP